MSPGVSEAIILRLRSRQSFLEAFLPLRPNEAPEARWTVMEERIKEIQASHALSKLAPQTFSAKVQRRMASTAPPRPIIDIGFDEASKYLAKMFDDVQRALQATYLSPVQGLGPIIVRVFPTSP